MHISGRGIATNLCLSICYASDPWWDVEADLMIVYYLICSVYVSRLLRVSEIVSVVLCFSHLKRLPSAEQEKLRTDDAYTKAGAFIVICVIACHRNLLSLRQDWNVIGRMVTSYGTFVICIQQILLHVHV